MNILVSDASEKGWFRLDFRFENLIIDLFYFGWKVSLVYKLALFLFVEKKINVSFVDILFYLKVVDC